LGQIWDKELGVSKIPILSEEPIRIGDCDYETRAIKCARCGAQMDFAPWPVSPKSVLERPRCGKCRSSFSFPIARKTPKPKGLVRTLQETFILGECSIEYEVANRRFKLRQEDQEILLTPRAISVLVDVLQDIQAGR